MKLTLVEKLQEAKDTFSFFFKPKSPFYWKSGQYLYIKLGNLFFPDSRGGTRQMTISSSTKEGEIVRITTRIRKESGFKLTLNSLPLGTDIEVNGPHGNFTIEENNFIGEHIFIAGGIGITPFRSLIVSNLKNNKPKKFSLLYSNSNPEFVFRKEIDEWAKNNNKNFEVNYIDSSLSGRINQGVIESLCINRNPSSFWISGSPDFVSAIDEILINMGIKQEQIITDRFTGY